MTRPALADVLAVMTTESDPAWWRGIVRLYSLRFDGAVVLGAKSDRVAYDVGRLRHETPAGALEALITAELLPAHWSDPARAPRWWCGRCFGRGVYSVARPDAAELFDGEMIAICHRCNVYPKTPGYTAAPPSHPVLVAVASLGVDTLARAEAIVAETWRARVVWRVMTAGEIREHHGQNAFGTSVLPRTEEAFSWEAHIAERDNRPWRAECPFGEVWGDEIRRTWPASTALRALNLHLLAVDDGRVTLAVKAL